MRHVSVRHGSTEALVDPVGAYVADLSVGGVRLVKPSPDESQTHGGAAVLIPYAGRVRGGEYSFGGRPFRLPTGKDGNAIHGFAREALWTVEQKTPGSVLLAASLEQEGYPSSLRAVLRYTAGSRTFRTECSVTNTGKSRCPLVVGFHPYFSARKWRLASPSAAYRYELQDRYFPNGKRTRYPMSRAGPGTPLDDCFRASGTVELLTEGYRLRMVRRRMPYLVIYNGRYAEGKSVAIEPYTGLPDAYNSGIGLQTLGPGQSFECGYKLTADPL